VIGIRTHEAYFEQLRDRCLFFCDLGDHFAEPRQADWSGAEQRLHTFLTGAELSTALTDDGHRMIHLDCPGTIALLAGRLVGPQAAMAIFHRVGHSARYLWMPDYRKPPPTTSPWVAEPTGDPAAGKLVVSVSVANNIRGDVERELERRGEPCWWVDFSPIEGPYHHCVRDADHANALARSLARELQQLQLHAKVDRVHLYVSVPNALLFLLGQQGVTLGRVQLYEFDRVTREYSPSLLIE
jgi:hypothetical protein